MNRNLLMSILAALALAPAAVHAQGYYTPGAGTYDQTQSGYYDHTGHWHAGEVNPYPDGTFDQYGHWHAYADSSGQGRDYDREDDQTGNGTYDRYGHWVPETAPGNSSQGGYYDENGQWHSNQDRYGYGGYGRAAGPDQWVWRERGRGSESLDMAARNFSLAAASVARNAWQHAGNRDREGFEALRRLDRDATSFARLSNQRVRPELVGGAYQAVINDFREATEHIASLQPDRWLSNQFYVMASNLGRVDRRYFGGRSFGGRNPGDLAGGYGQYQPRDRYPY